MVANAFRATDGLGARREKPYARRAAQFQIIMDNRLAVARLCARLGRPCARSGDAERSRKAYETGLTLWKAAGNHLPLLPRPGANPLEPFGRKAGC